MMSLTKVWAVGARVEVRSPLRYGSKLEYTACITHVGPVAIQLEDGTIWRIESATIARPGPRDNPADRDWHIELKTS
jgi:hypothetical protein